MKIGIVDDEISERIMIEKIIAEWAKKTGKLPSPKTVLFERGEDLLNSGLADSFDIIFMDIYMRGISGVETANLLRVKGVLCKIIFLASSGEHMLEAFRCHAFDYIVKPFSSEQIEKTLNDAVTESKKSPLTIALPYKGRIINIPFDNISYVLSDSNYCLVYNQEKLRCRISFARVEEILLVDSRFCTINRGVLVNLDYVSAIDGYSCIMNDGSTLPVNTKRKREIELSLTEYRFSKRQNIFSNAGT